MPLKLKNYQNPYPNSLKRSFSLAPQVKPLFYNLGLCPRYKKRCGVDIKNLALCRSTKSD